MSFRSKLPGLGEFKQILGQRLSASHRAVGPRGASWRLFSWQALKATQRLPPRVEARLSKPPGPAGERVFAYLHEVDVVLIDVKPHGQLGQE